MPLRYRAARRSSRSSGGIVGSIRPPDRRSGRVPVPGGAANREVLRRHREELRGLLPLDTREVLRCLRRGRLPGANGIVVI
jgi:hypothetical protein